MMECVRNGHEIVALANLHPTAGMEELDSYMYQSVGHDAIEAYAACMQLPLYRRPIMGSPLNIELDYEPVVDDEVECLYELLKQVKEKHPDVEAVSSGAIRSTYQKRRVENVCMRLGLTSLAFLWEADQAKLLQNMIDCNLSAIIIKVAVYGLGPADLGRSLEELQPKLIKLSEQFGVNVCGEGGEYESLTLNCPLFKKRLVIDETALITHKDSATAPVCFLKILKWHLE
jgi:diphthine-ammonia ligase